jgi:hypothetical protein
VGQVLVVEPARATAGAGWVQRWVVMAEAICARAGRLGAAGVAVRLFVPGTGGPAGAAPVVDAVEVFSNLLAEQCELLQSRVRQGPRVLADRSRRGVLVGDLVREERWPVFRATAAARYGLAAAHVEPLTFRAGPTLGSVAWYTDRAAGFGARTAVARRRDHAATVTVAMLHATRTGRSAEVPAPGHTWT